MEVLTADLTAVLEQARMLHGPPRPQVAAARNRLLDALHLRIPGWSLGAWDVVDGRPGEPIDETDDGGEPREDLRLVWLAETGHLLWLATDRGDPDLTVIVADTPRSFRGCVCDRADVGEAPWEGMVLRVPMLAACPLGFDAWREDEPRLDHRGGPAVLADAATRALDDDLAVQIRKVADPRQGRAEQTFFSWSAEGIDYRVPGVFAATATERPFPVGAAIPPEAIKHFLFVSSLGSWFSYTSHGDETSTIREFDTVRDLYRFQIAGRDEDDVFRQMWKNLSTRHPLARIAEYNPLARWASKITPAPDEPR